MSTVTSSPRLPYPRLAPAPYKALLELSGVVKAGSLGQQLIDLIFLRVSQINGCAYCVDLHWRDLIALGEDPRRLNSLLAWHENDFWTPRERAALLWAESLTRVIETHAPDSDFEALKAQFTDAEISELTFVVALMNSWNRIAIGMRMPVVKEA